MNKTPEEIKKGLEFCGSDNDCLPSLCPYYHECLFEDEYVLQKDALAYIQQLEAKVPKWISVEERLPSSKKPYANVIVRTRNGRVLPGFHNDEYGWYAMSEEENYCDLIVGDRVTHWMPLPEPPEV